MSKDLDNRENFLEVLEALGYMYGQYCGGRYGHNFMSAGEDAIEVLEEWGLHSEDRVFDYDDFEKRIDDLRRGKDE